MIAAILHLHIGARPALHALDQMPSRLGHAHNIVDAHFLSAAKQLRRRPGFGFHLVMITNDAGHLWHIAKHFRINLRRASGHDNRRIRIVFGGLADRITRRGDRRIRHRARIDNHSPLKPRRRGMAAHHFGLIGIEPTAKRNEFGRTFRHRALHVALLDEEFNSQLNELRSG